MATVCSVCGSPDTQAGLSAYQCVRCGALTGYDGKPAAHVEYTAATAPIEVTIPPGVVADLPAGVDGYVEGGEPVEYPSAGPETTDAPVEAVPAPKPPEPVDAAAIAEAELLAMKKAELQAHADALGIEVSGTKADMVEAITTAVPPEPAP